MSARRADDTDSGRRSQDLARDSASEEPKKKWYQFGKRPDSAHRGALEQAAKDQPQDEKRTTADKGKGGLLGSIPKLGARRSKVDDMTVIHVKPAKSSTSSAVDSWTPSGSSFSVTSQPAARKPAAGPAVPLSSDANVIATASTFVPVTAPR